MMRHPATVNADKEEFYRLAAATLAGDISDADAQCLENLVSQNPAASRWYAGFICDACNLRAISDHGRAIGGKAIPSAGQGVPVSLLDNAWASLGHRLGASAPFVYVVATILLAMVISLVMIKPSPNPSQVAQAPAPPSIPMPEYVGEITNAVGCQWAQGSTPAGEHDLVTFGRQFAIAAGVLEITYDAGARVILQGPATYTVEAKNGGFLADGKLTARLEKQAVPQAAGTGGTIVQPSFTIRTPSTTVTDLGTEFGVMSAANGTTEVHVIRGAVEVALAGAAAQGIPAHCKVTAANAVRIDPASWTLAAIDYMPSFFSRRFTPPAEQTDTAYIRAVLADGPVAYWPLNEEAGARRFADHSGNGFFGTAMGKATAGQSGPLSVNSRAVALDGKAYIDVGRQDRLSLSRDFAVEAWVWVAKSDSPSGKSGPGRKNRNENKEILHQIIAVQDFAHGNSSGWGVGCTFRRDAREGDDAIRFSLFGRQHCDAPWLSVPRERWVHVAMAFDQDNTARLYVNGRVLATFPNVEAGKFGPGWTLIGAKSIANRDKWCGRLAHVAVYPRALDAAQINAHYRLGLDFCKMSPLPPGEG